MRRLALLLACCSLLAAKEAEAGAGPDTEGWRGQVALSAEGKEVGRLELTVKGGQLTAPTMQSLLGVAGIPLVLGSAKGLRANTVKLTVSGEARTAKGTLVMSGNLMNQGKNHAFSGTFVLGERTIAFSGHLAPAGAVVKGEDGKVGRQ